MIEINTISDFYSLTPEQRGDICRNIKTTERLREYLDTKQEDKEDEQEPTWVPCKKCDKRGYVLTNNEERRNNADIHASQIYKCMKNLWYSCTPLVDQRIDKTDTKTKLTFQHGHMIHHMLQNYGRKGAWCNPEFYQDEAKIYPTIGEAVANNAHQLPEAFKYRVRSSVDAVIWKYKVPNIRGIGDVNVRLIHEYKSISPGRPTKDGKLYGGFASLTGPYPDHKQQASLYMQCFNVPITVFLYYNKGDDSIAEFAFPFNLLTWNMVRGKITKVLDYVDRNEMPPWEETSAVLNELECTKCEFLQICKPPKRFDIQGQ